MTATGYNSADDPTLLFGIGEHDEAEVVEVTWQNGQVQTLRDVRAGETLTITEATASSSN